MGVFETMLVVGGRPVELDLHMARLAASLETLFGGEMPTGALDLVRERARVTGLGRLRLTVAADGTGGLAAAVTAAVGPGLASPHGKRAVALRSHIVEGGLGAHKWADRRLLEAVEAAAPASSIPLLTDGNGTVLEASRANVFLALDGALLTPPLDGRILPGIARRRAIEVAAEAGIEVREEAVALDRLAQADEIFLTGSVRGVEPAASVDGTALAQGGPLSRQIAAGLRQRWLGATEPGAAPAPAAAPPLGRPAR